MKRCVCANQIRIGEAVKWVGKQKRASLSIVYMSFVVDGGKIWMEPSCTVRMKITSTLLGGIVARRMERGKETIDQSHRGV